jgi:hypothetical protein
MTDGMLATPSVRPRDGADRAATEATPVCIVARGHHELIQGLRAVFGRSVHILEDRRQGTGLLPREAGGKDVVSGPSHPGCTVKRERAS